MGLNFLTGDTPYQDRSLHGAMAMLENAVVAFFWEGDEPRLGTLTVTLPDRSSSPLLGERDRQLGLVIGAHLAASMGKMALVSTNLPLALGETAGRALLNLAQSLLVELLGKEE